MGIDCNPGIELPHVLRFNRRAKSILKHGGGVGAALSWQVRRFRSRRQTVGFLLRYGFAIRREILVPGLPQPHYVQGLTLGIDGAKLDLGWLEPRLGLKFKAL